MLSFTNYHHRFSKGLTLIELLVSMAILSILAAVALPYGEIMVTRQKEVELRTTLRELRMALDAFHEDWTSGKLARLSGAGSPHGYPVTLEVLVEGAPLAGPSGESRRYLRRMPIDPFSMSRSEAQWLLNGYSDSPDASEWNGEDVYDVRSMSERVALDGSRYRDW